MKLRSYQSTVIVLLCTTLAAGCSEQLSGGIVGEDGELGLGDSAIKAEKDTKDSGKKDSDDDDSGKKSSGKKDSDKKPSDKDSSETESSKEQDDESGDEETGSTGASSSAEDTSDDSTDETVSKKLKISFTTKRYGGRYGDYHVGAVWIEKKGGAFVRTIRQWGEIRQFHLVKWKAASKSNTVDAITGPTLFEHESHELSWDLRDVDQALVPDGDYVLHCEFTEDNSSYKAPHGPTLEVEFSLGEGGATLTPDGGEHYLDVELVVP